MTAAAGAPAGAQDPSGTVRVPFPQDDGTLTPYTFELGHSLVTLVYDTLMWRDEAGVPRPWLARSVEPGAGGRRVVVQLRDSVRWHDGEPLTAEDVAFSFAFYAERPHPRFTPQLEAIESVRAVDRLTVEFRLHHPAPGFGDQPLADVPILPRHLWADLPADRLAPEGLPVGSGPYRLVRHRHGKGYRFRAYRGHVLGPPAVGRVEVAVIRDAEAMLRALRSGQVDALPLSVPPGLRPAVAGLDIDLAQGPLYDGVVLLLNTRRAPFDAVTARRAVGQALDLERLAAAAGGAGAAVPADRGLLHPASGWAADAPLHRADQRAARAGIRRLDPLEILVPGNDPVRQEAGRQVAAALRRAGARAEAVVVDADRLAERIGQDGSPPRFQAAIWGLPRLASHDPDFLRPVFGTDGVLNYSGYASRRFDRLADRVASATEDEDRRAAVAEQLELLAAELPVVPLLFPDGAFPYRPAAHDGWTYVKGSGILDKRSFSTAPSSPEADRPVAPSPADAGGSGLGALGWLAIALAGAAVAIVAAASVRRR